MELIPILIKGAKITGITLYFEPEMLKWQATVSLLNQKDEQVTSIAVGNTGWDSKQKAELSLTGISLAKNLREEVETAVTLHLNKHQNAIEAQPE